MPKSIRGYRLFRFQFGFLCSFCDQGNQIRRRCSFRFILVIVLLISLQYFYNTSYKCSSSSSAQSENSNFTIHRVYHYHQRVLSYDRFMAMNYRLINLGETELPRYLENTPVCRLNYSTLGPVIVNKTLRSIRWMEKVVGEIRIGGFFAPSHCRSRHQVAILIPYRNRRKNLAIFLYHIHPILQKQLLQYRIFVIEQYGKTDFNKGALFNVAYLESQRFGHWHCLIFHDVDLIPQDERILYSCPRKPTHMSAAVDSMAYRLWYRQLFGGVTAMTPQQFLKVNGYSNRYLNWGAEDDDMYIRLQASRLPVLRLNASIARYSALPHKKATINTKRYSHLLRAKRRFRYEGLKTLQYKLIGITKAKLYTHILVDVNPFNYTDDSSFN